MCPPKSSGNAFQPVDREAQKKMVEEQEKDKADAQWKKNEAAGLTMPSTGQRDANGNIIIGAAQPQGSAGGAVLGKMPSMDPSKLIGDALVKPDEEMKAEKDTADILLRSADGARLMRARASHGRKASFLSPAPLNLLGGRAPQQYGMLGMPAAANSPWNKKAQYE